MVILTEETRLKRECFIQQIFDEICHVPNYSSFYTHIFYKIKSLGLQGKAKEEYLYDNIDWSTPKSK